jgi:hypothetical protein
VVRERLVVERGYLLIAGGPVQGDRLDEGAIGLQPQGAHSAVPRVRLDRGEQPGQQKETGRRDQVLVGGGQAALEVEAGVEAAAQLGKVRVDAVPGVRMARILRADVDQRAPQEALDLGRRRDEAPLL